MGLKVENIRYAHEPGHTDVCYGSDNRHIFTCGSDGYVRIWDGPDDNDSSSDFVADQALSVACFKDQYYVATNNNYVQGYTYSNRKRDKIVFRFSAPVTEVSVSYSGKFIAACSCDMEIQVLDTKLNKITILTGHTAPVLGVSLDPLDEYLVSSSCDGTVKIWELSSGSLIKNISDIVPVKNDFFKAVVLGRCSWKSMNGFLLAVPKGQEVILYQRNTWENVCKLSSKNIEKDLSAALFSSCGNYVAAASIGGEIIIWEMEHRSAVCYYKDPKKVGISGIIWHPDGSNILFCDRLGRFGVLTGISEEINRNSASLENDVTISEDDVKKLTEIGETNSLFDDDEEDVNSISLEKIKSTYQNLSDNDNGDEIDLSSPVNSPGVVTVKEPLVSLPEPQPPFQPSSTPSSFEPRCLCYNEIGMVRYYDSDRTIDIQFHDTMFHHSLFLRSFGVCTMATLSLNALCLAVPSLNDNSSKLTCISLGSWAGNKEWTVQMPKGEDIVAVAASGNWVAAATNAGHLRIFSHAGTQKQVLALPGPSVSLSGCDQKLFVVCHAGMGLHGSQNLGFIMYQISNIYVRATVPFQSLPLSPKSTLKWMGFTDEGTPSTYDSKGILRLLAHDFLHWMVICDTTNLRKSPNDNYFVFGLSETNQNIRSVLCRNSHYPLVINNPTVVEIPFKMPLCEMDDAKSIAEEAFWRLMFSIPSMQKISLDDSEMFKNFTLPMQQALLKLFGDATNNSDDLRAVDLATIMTKKLLDIAIKYSHSQGRTYLIEKLKALKPVDWTYYHPPTESTSTNAYQCLLLSRENENISFNESNNVIDSQQDLFEDSNTAVEKENKSSGSKLNESSSDSSNRISVNPFRKVPSETEEKKNLVGLKYFDTLSKIPPKGGSKSYLNKPMKVKLPSNKEKSTDSKPKKPTFVDWFSKRKASLVEEYPNISPSELTKMGMKLFKEEMSAMNHENKEIEVIDSADWAQRESKKNGSTEVDMPDAKKFKGLDDETP